MGNQFDVKIGFVSACNLPVGDFFHGDSDPYIIARIQNNDDDSLIYRTDTVHNTTEPTWDNDWWHVAGVRSGARLELKLEDEDPDKHTDDKLGEGEYMLDDLGALVDGGEKEIEVHIHKRKSNPRILLGTALLGMMHPKRAQAHAMVKLRITITKSEKSPGRLLLLGPRKYSIHRSPLVGRMAGTTDTDDAPAFLAFRLQLLDVPQDLQFEYTMKRPEIVSMFADNIKGRLIRRAVKSQHDTIYGYDRKTIYGRIEREQMAAVLLEMTDCVEDREDRTKDKLFTYAITLDGVLHFTETGSQYLIDHLSKHSMHANAAPVVVCSGEFFIRRRGSEDGEDDNSMTNGRDDSEVDVIPEVEEAVMENADKVQRSQEAKKHGEEGNIDWSKHERKDHHQSSLKPKINLSKYILVIDNDSGTYMPSADRLPDFQKFLEHNLPGLEVRALSRDDEKLKKWKEEHNERKEEVEPVGLASSGSSSSASSVSSVDREEVDGGKGGFMGKLRGKKHSWRTALSGLGSR
ncbi:hypothetical protein SAICODRAFT_6883 [Saitoella complicata NRRL Y-17804]|uniref:uncharacterized protein n=1 Tax=Saitoella complicata (strain BCRC 22490 / CBS 7301 / JCM 7358 / NBRC 10748 / NRRL Y-17804) TaxID=698492 RepID=UPI000866B6C9|nr:uncharacterized protein SAICODRAFT_6883 [Saitoella complicata NRRL Y-17804]ODQ53626.1 hypothetical protein SAICODRAFT_6883 [Saitoella complicata NRRL Y-17804]